MRWSTRRRVTTFLGVTMVIVSVPSTGYEAAQDTDNAFTSRVDVRMGRRQFQSQCANCHGLEAAGDPEGGGPDLTTGRFRRASSDAGLFSVIRDGVPNTAMIGINPNASDQTVWQIVTYLTSLSVSTEGVDLSGSADAGRALFVGRGECARCHMVAGDGGRQGPDLSTVGERRDPDELKLDLVNPNAEVDPRWWTITVTRQDGSMVEGLRMHEDSFSLRIMDEQDNLRSFSKSAIRSFERTKDSTMSSYAQQLTAQEVDDLVAYLFSLRRER